jgi:tetratricopeptide (TPR) repeat protein
VGDNPRIEELRRRVQADPASIAFAALAEEYRRNGNYPDAIETCQAGLKRHPSYLSAHVTLGRALIEVGRFDEAEEELQLVLKAAPENLAAIRGMAEIHHRRRDAGYDEAHLSNLAEEHAAAAAAEALAQEEAAAARDVAPSVQAPADEPPLYQPAAFEAPEREAPLPEAAAWTPAPVEAPHYDPPGTFEFPEVLPPPAAFSAPAAVIDERSPELEALESFLSAIVAARETVGSR